MSLEDLKIPNKISLCRLLNETMYSKFQARIKDI